MLPPESRQHAELFQPFRETDVYDSFRVLVIDLVAYDLERQVVDGPELVEITGGYVHVATEVDRFKLHVRARWGREHPQHSRKKSADQSRQSLASFGDLVYAAEGQDDDEYEEDKQQGLEQLLKYLDVASVNRSRHLGFGALRGRAEPEFVEYPCCPRRESGRLSTSDLQVFQPRSREPRMLSSRSALLT